MDAVNAIPNAAQTLFFVEGGGQLGLPGLNWGDGFVTDTSLIRQYGLSDPNSFFRTLLTKPYLNNVGISPHVYPPSVTYATQVNSLYVSSLKCYVLICSCKCTSTPSIGATCVAGVLLNSNHTASSIAGIWRYNQSNMIR